MRRRCVADQQSRRIFGADGNRAVDRLLSGTRPAGTDADGTERPSTEPADEAGPDASPDTEAAG